MSDATNEEQADKKINQARPKPGILIVDDDPSQRKILADILTAKGYTAYQAASGESALNKIRTIKLDIVLVDLRLGDMPGLDVLKEAKIESPSTACIVLTGHATQNSAIQAVNAGAYSFLQKPYDIDQLLLMIRRAIEQNEAVKALRASEERYRIITQNMSDTVWLMDMDLRTTFISPSVENTRLFSLEEIKKLPLDQQVTPSSLDTLNQTLSQILKPEQLPLAGLEVPPTTELEFYRKDGSIFCSECTFSLIKDEDGKPTSILVVGRDISKRKQSEKELQLRAAEFASLYETTLDLSQPRDLSTVLDTIINRAKTLLGVSFSGIYLYNPEREEMSLTVANGYPVPLGTVFRLGEDMAGRIALTCKPLIIDNYRTWEGRSPAYQDLPFSSILQVPMLYAGELVGVLSMHEIAPATRAFNDADAHLLSLFAAQAAGAVRNARLLEQTNQRLAELEAVNKISAIVRVSDSLGEMLERLLARTLEILGTEVGSIWLYDPPSDLLFQAASSGWLDTFKDIHFKPGTGIAGAVFTTGNAYISPDLAKDPFNQDEIPSRIPQGWLGTAVPIRTSETVVGVMVVALRHPRRVTANEVRLMGILAEIAGSAIHRTRLDEELKQNIIELQQRNVELAQMYRALESLIAAPPFNLKGLAQNILKIVLKEFSQANCSLVLVRQDFDELERLALTGPFAGQVKSTRLNLNGPGLIPLTIRTGKVQNVADVRTNPVNVSNWPGARSELTVPLKIGNQVTGVIDLQSSQLDAFKANDEHLMTIFGGWAALALEHTHLFEETESRLQHLVALRTIDMAINDSFDLRVILNILLDQVSSQLEVHASDILLFNPNNQTLDYFVGKGFRGMTNQRTQLRLGEGYAGMAALERRLVDFPDIASLKDGFTRSTFLSQEGFWAYYGIPLFAKGQIKGVLELFHREALHPTREWLDLLEMLSAQAALAIDNTAMFDSLQRSNIELVLAYDSTLEGWAKALELRDKEPGGHAQRVTELTLRLAGAMGVNGSDLVPIRRGALLHDIGKMGVPDSILFKPDSLTAEEWDIMKRHPVYAYELLLPVQFLKAALDIPYCHHEKWDGSGYPRGLKGREIPLSARIFAVADVYDALTSERIYRPAWTKEAAAEYILQSAGTRFDPEVVEAFAHIQEVIPETQVES